MSIAKGTFNINFFHSKEEMQRAYKHNYRHDGYYACNVDAKKSHLNEQLIGSAEESYEKAFERRISSCEYHKTHDIRKNAILAYSFCMGIGFEDMPERFDYDKWKKKNIDFLCNEFSSANVISAILHRDEGKPHIHAIVIPISDGKLSSRSYLPTRRCFVELHKRYYQDCTKDLGLTPENSGVFAHHKDVKRYLYTPLDNVAKECLCKPEPQETMEEYYERANVVFKDLKYSDLKKSQELRFIKEEVKLLRKANHREKEKIKEELKKEIIKDSGYNTFEEYSRRANAYDELQKGLDIINISDPERYQEFIKVINEIIVKAHEIDKLYDDEHVQDISDKTYGTIDYNNDDKYVDDLEDDLFP